MRGSASSRANAGDAGPDAASLPLPQRLRASVAAVQTLTESGGEKDPLSLVITTKNFRAFVAKASPLFWLQDQVEATLRWRDWGWTTMCMALWAVISYRPQLLLAAPSVLLSLALYRLHRARYPAFYPQSEGRAGPTLASLLPPRKAAEDPTHPPVVPTPVGEGSMQYLENLRDIQNMMRLVPDGYDGVSLLVPYLNWSDPGTSRLLLQLSVLSSVLALFLAPYVPVRLVLLLMGEGPLLLFHPWIQPLLPRLAATLPSVTHWQDLSELSLLDRLPDTAWQCGWNTMEMYENQRLAPAGRAGASSSQGAQEPPPSPVWGTNLLPSDRQGWTRGPEGWSPPGVTSSQVVGSLPRSWVWAEEEWRVDTQGTWSPVGADEQGWVYTDTNWASPSASPCPEDARTATTSVPAEWEEQPTPTSTSTPNSGPSHTQAVTRRRRWIRRCIKLAGPDL